MAIDDPELLDHVRVYRLATEPFHMAPSVQEEQPAVTLDWLLHIDEAVAAAQAKKLEQARRS